jgi:hypothetical protein
VPFRGEGAGDIIAAHIHLTPPLPKRDGLPSDVVGLIGEMLGKKPDARPPTMDALVARLAPVRTSAPRPAATPPKQADVDAVAATLDGSDPALHAPSATADTMLPTEPSPPPEMTPPPSTRRDPTPVQGPTTTLRGAAGSTAAPPPPPSRRGIILGAAGAGIAVAGVGAWWVTRGSSTPAKPSPRTWPLQIDFRMPRSIEALPETIGVSVDGFVAKLASPPVITPPSRGATRSLVVLVEATERFLGNETHADWGVIEGAYGAVAALLAELDGLIDPGVAVQLITFDTATTAHGSFAKREAMADALEPQVAYARRLGADLGAAIERARGVLAKRTGERQLLIFGTGLPLELGSEDRFQALRKQLAQDRVVARAALFDPVGGFEDEIRSVWSALQISPRLVPARSEVAASAAPLWNDLPVPWRIHLELALPESTDPEYAVEIGLELFEEHTFSVNLVDDPRVDLGEL